MTSLPSKTQINKCGETARQVVFHGKRVPPDELERIIDVITLYRAAHSYPMTKIRMGLQSMVRTERADETISQRLKRVPRIVRKLERTASSPTGRMMLARLEDIGGVRAIVADGAELTRLRRRVERNWGPAFQRPPRDYIANPKDIGYRAVHFVVVRDGRAIEVQLRTRGQQQWADAVESADARFSGMNLKDGDGPESMLEYFSSAGELIHRREYGLPIASAVRERFAAARKAVVDAGYYRA